MVGIIREDSPGKAAALLAAGTEKALEAPRWRGGAALPDIHSGHQVKMDANQQLMDDGLTATARFLPRLERGHSSSKARLRRTN